MRAAPFPDRDPSRLPGLWPLAVGLAALALLWGGPLPFLARTSFSWHMILHVGVIVGAAPLVAGGLVRLGWAAGAGSLGFALAASVAEFAVVWGWHLPGLHAAAALFPSVFVIQQASFLAVGIAVWLPGLAPGRAAAGAGALALLLGFMHMTMLGVLLAAAPRLVYDPAVCGGAFGLGPLDDQRLGGLLMALGAGLPYAAGAAVMAHRLISGGEARRPAPAAPFRKDRP